MRKNTKRLLITITVVVLLCIIIPTSILLSQHNNNEIMKSEQLTLLQFFGLNDGLDIIWAHAVNNQNKLESALNDPKILMLEADVLLSSNNTVIMAHPPETTSDITLETWLETVLLHRSKKGIKLDFKSTSVLPKALEICQNTFHRYPIYIPLILNADILRGPNNNITQPVDPKEFITTVSSVSNAIVSPGWTTNFIDNFSSGYTQDTVVEMNQLMIDMPQYITFPIRASLVLRSLQPLMWLLQQNPKKYTLTVWTSKTDVFDIAELKSLRCFPTQVYYDLPEENVKKLRELEIFCNTTNS